MLYVDICQIVQQTICPTKLHQHSMPLCLMRCSTSSCLPTLNAVLQSPVRYPVTRLRRQISSLPHFGHVPGISPWKPHLTQRSLGTFTAKYGISLSIAQLTSSSSASTLLTAAESSSTYVMQPPLLYPANCASVSIFSNGVIFFQTGTWMELVKNSWSDTPGISPYFSLNFFIAVWHRFSAGVKFSPKLILSSFLNLAHFSLNKPSIFLASSMPFFST